MTTGADEKRHPAAFLRKGMLLSLKPSEPMRVTLRGDDHRTSLRPLHQRCAAEIALAHAYQLLQTRAVAKGAAPAFAQEQKAFAEALSACRAGRQADAESKANARRFKLRDGTLKSE